MNKQLIIILATLLLPLAVFAHVSPGKPTGLVNDFARVLTPSESQSIGEKLLALNKQTGVELVVVTVPTIGTDESIESYAVKLFEEWEIGNKEKDTGLLLLIAVNDRQMKIETGYGIEGAVTDIQSGNVIRNVLTPAFKAGKYGEGISGAVDALTVIITKSPEAAQYSIENEPSKVSAGILKFFFGLGPEFAFFVLVIIAVILGKSKSWWLGGVIGAGIGVIIGMIAGFFYVGIISTVILSLLGLLFDFIVSKHPPQKGGRFWMFFGGGRGGSGGFGGGGFGGFGGGSSGGGGASGRW